MLLRKKLQLSDVQLKMEGDGHGRFSGYASVFGGTHASGDIVVKGAFAETLRLHGMPKMFLEHSWVYGGMGGAASLPIGKYAKAQEDDHGLYVEGEFTPDMSLSNDVRAAMKHGTLDGLSVSGFVKKGDYVENDSGRVIHKWTRLVEVSPVVFPDDGAARVDLATVKGGADLMEAIADAETIRDLEGLLRDAAGLSKGAATALVARVKSLSAQGDPGAAEALAVKALHQRLTRFADGIPS